MRNYFKYILMIAMAAAMITFTGCAGEGDGELVFGDGAQTVITITNIPNSTGYVYVTGALSSATSAQNAKNKQDMGISFPAEKIVNGTVNLRMYSANSVQSSTSGLPLPASVSGAGFVLIFIHTTDDATALQTPNLKWQGGYYTGVSPGQNPPISYDSMTQVN